jgi:hypothetical protein
MLDSSQILFLERNASAKEKPRNEIRKTLLNGHEQKRVSRREFCKSNYNSEQFTKC